MRARIFGALAAIGLLVAVPARAAEPAATTALGDQLYVELVLNGVETGALVALRMGVGGGAVLADAAALRQAGVALGEAAVRDGLVDVAALPGFVARYDEAMQRLLLDVPAERLPTQSLAGAADRPAEALADTGFLLGYDAFVRRTGKAMLASLWTEQRLFGAAGTLSNTGVLRTGSGMGSGMGGKKARGRGAAGSYLRYDTAVQVVDQRRLATLTAGDVVTGVLPWNAAVRIGGVQLARSFRVRPDLVTMPLPRFQGAAAVPSGVDLLVNGTPAGHHDVAPGPYVLNDLPAVSGAGDVTVVTTDAVGRQVATTARFYVAPELLRPGLTDFSVEAGFLRRRYGQSSFRYGRAVASGTVRRGLTRRLTAEFHAEGARGLAQVGGGLAWSPGRWGVVQGAMAASRGQDAEGRGVEGRQWVAGYSYLARRFSLGVQRLDRSAGFRDLAGLDFDLARSSGAARSDRVWASTALGAMGSLGAAYVAADTADGTRVRLLSATWSGTVGRRLTAFATLGHDARSGGLSGQVRLLLPFGRSSLAAGVGTEPDRGWTTRASYARARSSDGGAGPGGWGLAADAAMDERGRAWGQANASVQLATVRTEVGAALAPGGTALWAGASGAVIAMAGDVFRTPVVPGAFAVVSTGVAHVPVRYENQMVGVTGRSGTLLVAAPAAYQPGRYAIDTLDLPAGMTAARVEVEAALRGGAGAVIRLPVRAGRSAVAALVDAEGQPLDAGDMATLPDGRVLPVGWGGELMLEDAAAELAVAVQRRDGRSCRAAVRVPLGPAFQRLEAVACR